ncbi:MAG TPA: hypothetical protein VFR95_03035 [Gemmatimonadaceae bacterium]|nr:hypothetical protein [Gemmatimonadaceae bacterium]
MTLGEWLDGRTPKAPVALAERVRAVLGPALDRELDAGRGHIHAALLDAARSLLSATPGCASPERRAALDLLAADALVTYAFEIAAEVPEEIDSLAESAMRALGALAPEGST